jgi:hypothetical protein
MEENPVVRGMINSALIRGALAEAEWQRKDREEGFGTWPLDELETKKTFTWYCRYYDSANYNTHTARPETD